MNNEELRTVSRLNESGIWRVKGAVFNKAVTDNIFHSRFQYNSTLHPQHSKLKKAFTLAEVLITLGVIGVVAAMTMPALVQNYKKMETVSRLKKFYSMMNQAIKLSEIDNGDISTWNKVSTKYDNGAIDFDANSSLSKDFFLKYFAPYIKYVKFEDRNPNEQLPVVYLSDGSSFMIWNGGCMDFIYDVNGNRNPNENGRDQFNFTMCNTDELQMANCGNKNHSICPINTIWGNYETNYASRDRLLDLCRDYTNSCVNLIMYDGWEIKDDYPYKL